MQRPVNDQRTARVADLLSDFRTLQYYIAAAPTEPPNLDDYYTEGWAALRQCSLDGQHILNCAAETRVPRVRGGAEEQAKAELQQYVFPRLGSYRSRRAERLEILVLPPSRSPENLPPTGRCPTLDRLPRPGFAG
jgi:hypothetical protein